MKILPFLLVLFVCGVPVFGQKNSFVLYNSAPVDRTDELIILRKKDLTAKITDLRKTKYLTITDGNNKPLTLQFDDLDKDGNWDEVVFLYSFKAGQKFTFSIFPDNKKPAGGTIRAHVRQRRKNADNSFGPDIAFDSIPSGQPNTNFNKVKLPPFLTEGPAWENDKVGFRIYFDIRNGKDIWGKTTKAMMMDTVGVDPTVIYHNRAPWGMDIYKVGSSLSAGALALSLKLKNGQDTLIRLGGVNMGKVLYERVADGPVRAIFRMHYPVWNFAQGYKPMSLTEEISISGGQYNYQSSIIAVNMPENAKLVTGFANLYGLKANEITGKHFRAVYSYGLQSENKDNLGLAIVVPDKLFKAFKQTSPTEKDIKDSYLVYLYSEQQKFKPAFRFYACWQQTDERFSDPDKFTSFLTEQLKLADEPVRFSWK